MGRLALLAYRLEQAAAALAGKQFERRTSLQPRAFAALAESRAGWGGGIERESDNFDSLQAYRDTAWVYAACYRIGVCLAMAPLTLLQGDSEGKAKELAPNHPARVLFKNPNPYQSRFDLWEDTGLFLELMGEAPWELAGLAERYTPGTPGAFPKALMCLRPDLLKPVASKDSFIGGYVLRVGGQEIKYRADEIMMVKWRDPTDDYRGLGSVRPARDAVLLDSRAIRYNRSQFDNLGVPAVVLEEDVPAGTPPLQDDQVKELKAIWDAQFAGPSNAFRTRVAAGGLKVKEFGTTPRDMQYQEARRWNRQEVLAAFGVPPALVGVYETAIRANAKEQRADFWEDTMVPKLRKIEETLNSPESGLFWRFGPDIFCRFDLTQIPALREDATSRVARRQALFDRGAASRNELREAEGLPSVPGFDDFYLTATYLSAGMAQPERAMRRAGGQKGAHTLGVEIRRAAHWKLLNAQWLGMEAEWRRAAHGFLADQEARVLERAKHIGDLDQITPDRLFPRDEEEEVMAGGFEPLIGKTVAHGGRVAMRLVKSAVRAREKAGVIGARKANADDLEFDELDPRVRAYIATLRQKLVRQVNGTTWEAVRGEITASQAAGETILELMDRLRVTLNQRRSDYELSRIARTEVIKANNGGAQEAYKQSGAVEEKQWLTARDGAGQRHAEDPAYADLDGQVVPLDGAFAVGADNLDYPGDPDGEPGEIINCRCTMVPYFRDLEEEVL